MSMLHSRPSIGTMLLVALGLVTDRAAAQATTEQTFTLRPGWNAIYLEVEPLDDDVEAVFAGLPVASVWTWQPRDGRVGFIPDPANGLLNTTGWSGYFPRPRPESFLTNLFILRPNRAYLIELEGDSNVALRVTGYPRFERRTWLSDSFNLTGLEVDEQSPPTFGAYFEPAAAHAGQPIYRLSAGGVWQRVAQPQFETIRAGEAYWIYSQGASSYQGPMELELLLGDRIEFGGGLDSAQLRVRNRLDTPAGIRLRQRASQTPLPLSVQTIDDSTGESAWPALPPIYERPIEPNDDVLFQLAPRRTELVDRGELLLEVSNGLGARRLLVVAANVAQSTTPAELLALRPGDEGRALRVATAVHRHAGLWAGVARVDAVSLAQLAGTLPVPVGKDFELRLLVHVDRGGQARLLKEVVQLYRPPVRGPDPATPGYQTVIEPGDYVLVTNQALLGSFDGVAMRDGVPVGLRLSSAAYDFDGQWRDMSGSFGSTLTVSLDLPRTFPTNPFRHPFHPDHDNQDALFLNPRDEAQAVGRTVELAFGVDFPQFGDGVVPQPPDWGADTLGGVYREQLTGIHKNTIYVSGKFLLSRVSATPALNGQ